MKKHTFLLIMLLLVKASSAQEVLPDGYYTFSTLDDATEKLTFAHDEDALRPVYGNSTDYNHPTGRNGETAYLYAQLKINTSQAQQIYYFKRRPDGKYTIQSCSGTSHSYLDVAAYDRHLVCHSTHPRHAFSLHPYDYTKPPQWEPHTRVMQTYMHAAIFDSLATRVAPLSGLSMLLPVEGRFLTPDLPLRRALSDAKGILATYPSGDNPGQVPAVLSHTLNELITEGDAYATDKNLTPLQAEGMIKKLQEITKQYETAAKKSTLPVCQGYYFAINAYRAFELRQKKQKAMAMKTEKDGKTGLIWNSLNPNDGNMVVHLVPTENSAFYIKSFDEKTLVWKESDISFEINTTGTPFYFTSEDYGMWTIAPQNLPSAFLTANNPAKGRTGLYGNNVSDAVIASEEGHLYTGYCASWYLQKAYHTVNVPSNGWAGLTTSFPVQIPAEVRAYIVTEVDGQLHAHPHNEKLLPACATVLIRAPRGTYTFVSCVPTTPLAPINSVLKPCHSSLRGIPAGTMALLKMENDAIGFAKSTQTSLQAGAVYLPFSTNDPDFRPLIVHDYPAGINDVSLKEKATSRFDLSGRPVHTRQKGIHITNNKKILIR